MSIPNPPKSISDWYHICLATFEKIDTELANLPPGKTSESIFALEMVQPKAERLKSWAEENGADKPASSWISLDYKLSSLGAHFHDNVEGLLMDLDTLLLESSLNEKV